MHLIGYLQNGGEEIEYKSRKERWHRMVKMTKILSLIGNVL